MSQAQIQGRLLNAAIGLPGSGTTRYAAAMFFYTQGQMTAEMLEIYRACSKCDNEDPIALAKYENVSFAGPDLFAPETEDK